jgi:hypothetical protein
VQAEVRSDVPGPAIGNTNAASAAMFRSLVASHARERGFEGAEARPNRSKLSDSIGDIGTPDVTIGGVWIAAHARLRHTWSIDLDRARRDADLAGVAVSAIVQHRGGRPIGDSYALLRLDDLLALLGAPPS